MDINFNDTNNRILWCAAWNQAANLWAGKIFTIEQVEKTARELFIGMYKPYQAQQDNSEEQWLENGKPIVNEKAKKVVKAKLPKGQMNIDPEVDETFKDIKEHYGNN